MAEGKLYCEHCGEDIHIVPDFEPELEQTIQDILEELHGDMEDEAEEEPKGFEELEDFEEPEDEGDWQEEPVRRKRIWPKVLLALVFLLFLAAGGAAWHIYSSYSEEYQLNRAEQYLELGKYDEAIICYNRAVELDSANVELLFELADIYLLKNNKVEYEYLLREIINNKNATAEQLEGAYGKLISIYRERRDYQTINALLLASGNENLIAAYPNYIVDVPEFSINEGYYTSIQPLKLTASGACVLESNVPRSEIVEVILDNDVLKIDGSFAICWSGSLQFTVERSGKTLVGSAASGEGLVNVYRGTGRVMLAPPLSLSPVPLAMMRPRTVTFSSFTSPRPTPPVMYRSPLMMLSRRVTPGAVMVTLPNTPPRA